MMTNMEVKGQEWLQKELEGMDANELRTLCVPAGVSCRAGDSRRSKAELVELLTKATSPSIEP